jgi:hypothetical protein
LVLRGDSYPYEFREVLIETSLPMETDLRGVDLPHLLAIGLMLRSNRLLAAVQVMVHEAMPDVVDVLLRPILENVVTAFWLLESPEERLPVMLGDHRRYVHRMATSWPSRDSRFVAKSFDAFMTSHVGHCRSASLPSMKERADALWDNLKATYRYQSAALHGSVSSSWKSFHQLRGGVIIRDAFDEEEDLPEFGIAHASYLLLSLAKRIHEELRWSDDLDDIEELLSMVEGWNPES